MLCFRPSVLKGLHSLALKTIFFAICFKFISFHLLRSASNALHCCSFLPPFVGRVNGDGGFRFLYVRSFCFVLLLPYFIYGVLAEKATLRYCRIILRAMECISHDTPRSPEYFKDTWQRNCFSVSDTDSWCPLSRSKGDLLLSKTTCCGFRCAV